MIAIRYNGAFVPLAHYSDHHVTHKADGNDELHFQVETNDPQYPLIIEEAEVQADGNLWLVKKISDSHFDCALNLDELRISSYWNYTSDSLLLSELLSAILDGWTIIGAEAVTIRRTITLDYGTDFDIISRAAEVFGVAYRWNTLEKTLTVIKPDDIPVSGEYLTTELNLRKLTYKGETANFATRLYAVGADGLTPRTAVIDGVVYGKDYVEDYSYSDKVVTAFWVDERYTVAEQLYADALAKLLTMSRPVQSYECDVLDLAKRSSEYSFLEFVVHRKLTLIDTDRHLRVVHKIVEYDEYPEPEDAALSKVTLASVAPDVSSMTTAQATAARVEATNAALSALSEVNENISEAQRVWEISSEELYSLIQSTKDDFSSFQQLVDSFVQTVSNLETSVTNILDPNGEFWTFKRNTEEALNAYASHISFEDYNGQPAILLWVEGENPYKVRITNNSFQIFTSDDNILTFVTNTGLHGNSVIAEENVQIGDGNSDNWLWHKLPDGSLALDLI